MNSLGYMVCFINKEIIDKGSAWIGPAVVGIIGEIGDKRHSFWFLLVMLVLSIFIFNGIDVDKGKQDASRFVMKEILDPGREDIPLVQKTLLH